MEKNNKGISLISLIITIIVIIILASIVIFNGLDTPESARYAKFTSDLSNLQETVDQRYGDKYSEYAVEGKNIQESDIYRWIAAGDHPTTSGMVMVPAGYGSQYNSTLSNVDSSGNSLVWYVKVLTDSEKEIVEIDREYNKLNVSIPQYEGRTWKIRTSDGKVILDPPYEYKGKLYASMDDIRTSGAQGNFDGSYDVNESVNSPVLTAGMIPVYYDDSAKVWKKADATNTTEPKWYNYSGKRWANIVTVKSDVRSGYESAGVGTEIKEDDVIGYFVWIPRYAYKVGNQMMDIVFLKGTTNEFSGGTVGTGNDYITHPVFTNSPQNGGWDKELSGIWVAKFESSSSETELVEDTGYTTVKVNPGTSIPITGSGKISNTIKTYGKGNISGYVTIRPNVTSWKNISVSDIFAKSASVASDHGINVDSHMMKNTEWGAVAYLTQSKYGNTTVWNNSYNEGEVYTTKGSGYGIYSYCGTITGMVGSSKDEATDYFAEKIAKTYNEDGSVTIKYKVIKNDGSIGNEFIRTYYSYNTTNGVKGSTTIYDMSGGAWEYVSAYLDNGSDNVNIYKTGLSGKYANIYKASSKDDKISTSNSTGEMSQANYNENLDKKGDAMVEISTKGFGVTSWGGDSSVFAFGGYPFVIRGGSHVSSSSAGLFAFNRTLRWRWQRIWFSCSLGSLSRRFACPLRYYKKHKGFYLRVVNVYVLYRAI